ncbi:hypothetical protein [Leptospira sp. GIMC2001]|uniref:hypothetical protein n=1 Tax=Leptospira sp. GIMC2001 TaxID=1513297 RepID=UPI00234B81E0|nr:hypothetical protein [Leptospira sp. GIMC2001]WCL48668.1 hypothetical protein O4O04_15355 [Leptospira sp. GIMC2001]
MGLSRIYWKKEWKAQSYAYSILLRIATLYFHSERTWMLTFLEEFSFFVEGRERWNTYLSFRETKKTPLPADHFEISKSFILELSIPYEDAAIVILDQVQPASFQKGNVKLIVAQSLIQGISYPLWSENFETKKDIWLRDFFLNVRSIKDSNPSAPYWQYIGSNYSNEILTQACLHLKMKRKLIHWKLKIDLVDDRCSVNWNHHPTITLNRTKKNIHLTNDSRMRGSILAQTYQTQSNSNPITCTIWTGGIYDLDIQRMDLPPILFST